MPAFHAHDGDFLFQIQHPVEPSSSDPANAFLKSIVSRIRNARQIDIYQGPSASVFLGIKAAARTDSGHEPNLRSPTVLCPTYAELFEKFAKATEELVKP